MMDQWVGDDSEDEEQTDEGANRRAPSFGMRPEDVSAFDDDEDEYEANA
jgi:hypothetical protein